MTEFSAKALNHIRKKFKGKKIAVIGDLMLDGYYWGDVKRISPEAPVPIVEIEDEFFRFGGAANVALNLLTLGAEPFPIGVIGNDLSGKIFLELMDKQGIRKEGIIRDKSRPTTVKTRVIAGKHHIVRIDRESKKYIDNSIKKKIIHALSNRIDELDAVIIQDYNKGVLSEELISDIISICNSKKKIITVDPKFDNFFEYKDVTVFKPNRKETEDALKIKLDSPEKISFAGDELIKNLNSKYLLLTLGEEGIALFEKDKPIRKVATKARKVADVSGAGDTVISTLTIALTAGANIAEAAYLANFAGGLVCEEIGIVPIDVDKLFTRLLAEL
ncbi:MAG: D-glycero-beta-D-manno-heptose-7-phosphate kinase [Bacteroidetes bacterium]|nr:D-glycero-beta-D-manno-heptose-7-phosphate kinase [Bacteroidota bacterium]MBU1680001.1 D-glycero-beta-D-manno-heptose-7-phosphate kinase [Bacteroidota bacterium]